MAATISNRRQYLRGALLVAAVLGTAGLAFTISSVRPLLQQGPITAAAAEYLGTELWMEKAPDFRLTDQRGASVGLADFKGKAIALAFLDPNCTDACPLTALQFRLTAQALGNQATEVVFLAINVNEYMASVADVREATEKWGNSEMPNWHFLTGSASELHPLWDAYHIAAAAGPKPDKPNEQLHTPGVYIIDQAGRRRWYVSVPFGSESTISWQGPALNQVLKIRFLQLLKPANG